MNLGKLQVEITADSTGLNRGLKNVDSRLAKTRVSINKLGTAFAKFSAAGVAAVGAVGVALVKSQLASIDALAKTSDKLNIAIEDLQGLRFAAEQTGVATGTLDTALQRMIRRVSAASIGTGEAVNALKELGLSAKDLATLAPDEQFAQIAEAMEGVSTQGDRVRLAMALFDTEGVALVNTMKGGADAINGFKQEAIDLGLTLSRVDAAQVEAANDALNRIQKVIQGGLQQATVELAPLITVIANELVEVSKQGGGMATVVVNGMQSIAKAFARVMDVVHIFKLGFMSIKTIVLGVFDVLLKGVVMAETQMQKLVNGLINKVNGLFEKLNSIPLLDLDIKPIDPVVSKSLDNLKVISKDLSSSFEDAKDSLFELSMQGLPSGNIDSGFNDLLDKIEDVKTKIAEAAEEKAKLQTNPIALPPIDEQTERADIPELDRAGLGLDNKNELEKIQADFEAKREMLIAHAALLQQDEMLDAEQRKLINEQLQNDLTTIEENAAKKREELAEAERMAKVKATAGAFTMLSSLMNTGSKKLFAIGKAAAKAGAILDGYAAVQGAIKEGNKVGGPVVGAAFGAVAAVQTAVQVRNINQQQFGGAGGGAGTFIGGLPAIRTTDAQGGQGGSSVQRNVSINLQGSNFSAEQVRGLIGQINSEIGDGVTVLMGG